MKKIIILMICAVLALSLWGCGDKKEEGPSGQSSDGTFSFTTTDFDGNGFSSSDIEDAVLVMINIWEPWCGPCVGEIPYLAKLYDEYRDEGFLILGVFSSEDMDDSVEELIAGNGIHYPLLRWSREFRALETGYVPTTVFINGKGEILTDEAIVGSNSYEAWKALIEEYLEKAKK
ncbi:MAG: TlpA family protein disulfide reductase [Eubacteriaceae bacterium]|nr:TlpA family protein disulfide reductase [Eubacteriaceae bacterium]